MTYRLMVAISLAIGQPALADARAIPRNPYLADSPNNQSHWNDAASDSTVAAAPEGHFCVTPGSFAIEYADALGIPAYGAEVGGQRVYWFFSGTALRKLILDQGQWLEIARQPIRMPLPGYRPVSRAGREQQAARLKALIEAGDENGIGAFLQSQPNRLQQAVEDQVAHGVLYSLFTRDHGFVGANARGLVRIDNLDPADPFSGFSAPRQVTFPAALFNDAKVAAGTFFPGDSVFGLGMTFNGYIVVSTLGGKIATIDRDTLEVIDAFEAPNGELFTNSFATSAELEGGAVYIASNHKMYRLAVDKNGKFSSDAAQGAWSADYDAGIRLPTGKIADGTGATPTLMGFGPGEDKLVVLTDGAAKMRLVAFWRDELPPGWKGRKGFPSPRIADQARVDFGPDFPVVQSEQSVVADDGYAFVVNSILSGGSKPMPVGGAMARGLVAGAIRPLPRGAAMYRWDDASDRWRLQWQRTDVGTIATVPMLSKGSRQVVVNGTLPHQPGRLFHLGFDLDDGHLKLSIDSGADPRFNGAFTGIKSDDDGTLMYTTMFGLVRFHTDRMRKVASPESNDSSRDCGSGPDGAW